MIYLALYTILWIAVSQYVVGVIHYSENKRSSRLDNRPRYFEVYLFTSMFILPSLLSTFVNYGYRYQKPVKGVTYL